MEPGADMKMIRDGEIPAGTVTAGGGDPKIIAMKRGIPGFEQVERYSLRAWEEGSPFGVLQSLAEGGPWFIVVNPFLACPGYEPVIPDREARFLGIEDSSQASLIAIVTVRHDPLELTVNLRAPILINTCLDMAAQVVLDDDHWPVRYSVT